MTKHKFRICVILLAFSLVLTLGTIRLLSDSDPSDQTNPTGDDLNESQNTGSEIVPASTVDIPTALTEPTTEETTAVPTDETTEEPAQEPTQQVTVPVVQGGTEIFNDAAFIGDSVTLKLRNYHMETGALGKTTFLCIGSYGVNNAVTNQLYLSYQGKDMTPQDALKACGAKKVFILLGMNDIALFGENSINVAMDNWAKLLQNIREKNPDIKIYIQSVIII